MKYTNRHNIHEAIARAVEHDPWRQRGDATITQLIRPPLMAYLEMTHDHEIEVDVSDRLWALLGQAVHEILGRARVENGLQEEALELHVGGWQIAGRPDLWQEGIVTDFKVTSVWSFLLGDKADWDMQLNFYALLYSDANFPVKKLEIAAILRDWQHSRFLRDDDYPPSPFMRKQITIWPFDVAMERLLDRVRLHQAARAGNPRYCTDEERWAKPDTYAVKKAGQKRALRVFDTEPEATALVAEKGNGLTIESRKGDKWVRCRDYCDVAKFCPQFNEQTGTDADVQEPQRS